MDGRRDEEVAAAARHGTPGPVARGGVGTNGAPVSPEATKAPFVPGQDPPSVERTPNGVVVEVGVLPDGRAIRYFSWASDHPRVPRSGGGDESRVTDVQCLQRDSADTTVEPTTGDHR